MGSYNISCGITGLNIELGERTGFFLLKPTQPESLSWRPAGPPIVGLYADYGRLEVTSPPADLPEHQKTFLRLGLTRPECLAEAVNKISYDGTEVVPYTWVSLDAWDAIRKVPEAQINIDMGDPELLSKLGFELQPEVRTAERYLLRNPSNNAVQQWRSSIKRYNQVWIHPSYPRPVYSDGTWARVEILADGATPDDAHAIAHGHPDAYFHYPDVDKYFPGLLRRHRWLSSTKGDRNKLWKEMSTHWRRRAYGYAYGMSNLELADELGADISYDSYLAPAELRIAQPESIKLDFSSDLVTSWAVEILQVDMVMFYALSKSWAPYQPDHTTQCRSTKMLAGYTGAMYRLALKYAAKERELDGAWERM